MTIDTDSSFFKLAHEMVVESTNQAYQMLLGGMPTNLETHEVPPGISEQVFDFMGSITATGESTLTLSLGLNKDSITTLGQIMMGQPIEDETILVGCHQELLNIILGGTMGALSQISPLKLDVPEMSQNTAYSFTPEKEEGQILFFSSDTIRLEMLLKILK